MIELQDDELGSGSQRCMSLPNFGWVPTPLRIPDDNRDYPLPPGLGTIPLNHVDDHADRVPETWRKHGGVFLPCIRRKRCGSTLTLRTQCR